MQRREWAPGATEANPPHTMTIAEEAAVRAFDAAPGAFRRSIDVAQAKAGMPPGSGFARLLPREPASALTHAPGIALAVAGTWHLLARALWPVRPWHLAGYAVFGLCGVLLYAASTLFHWARASKDTISALRKLDHIMIFVFIAATYTPFCLVPFRGPFGLFMLSCIWCIAAAGSVVKLSWMHMPRGLCVSLHLFAGFFSMIGIGRIISVLGPHAVSLLFTGGAFYCIGAALYLLESDRDLSSPKLFGLHEAFHLMVLLGGACHYMCIARYVDTFA